MSSTRLTNELRNRIAKAVLNHRFEAEEKALDVATEALGDLIYESLYPAGGNARKRLDTALDGEYAYCTSIDCHLAGDYRSIPMSKQRPVQHKHYSGRAKFDANAEPVVVFRDIQAKRRKLKEHKDETAAKVNGLLSEATTIKKLMEIWPEVEPFIPPAVTPVNLPAVPRDEVNSLLGLPTKTEVK